MTAQAPAIANVSLAPPRAAHPLIRMQGAEREPLEVRADSGEVVIGGSVRWTLPIFINEFAEVVDARRWL